MSTKRLVDETRIKKCNTKEDQEGSVCYLMQREHRVNDNWALLYAQQKSQELQQSLVVVVCIDPAWYPTTARHYDFMIQGLQEVESELKKLHIPLYVLLGDLEKEIIHFVKEHHVGALVTDFNPLHYYQTALKKMSKSIACSLYEVDAHNIVPCWVTSQKQEYAARTIRSKIHKNLASYLTEFPNIVKNTVAWPSKVPAIAWKTLHKKLDLDAGVKAVTWLQPGEKEAHAALRYFIKHTLQKYAVLRNDPAQEGQSNVSPYLHFGHIAAQRIALEIQKVHGAVESKSAFLEELIVRKELTDNYCYYNPKYASVAGAAEWAHKTLKAHEGDKREYLYTKKQLEDAVTHDELWNAAQLELVHHGKMHGYMRMYWAKKILEWSKTPETAMATALYLNDKYSLDGTDPNGYVGVAWSTAGVHDRAWFPRKIFGTIRYMSYNGCKGKFDIKQYVSKVQRLIKKD